MRYWSLLFLAMAAACVALFAYAPSHPDYWLPRNVSTLGREVDHLFLVILYITGAVFIATQLVLAYVTWTGASRRGRKIRARHFHGSIALELAWTIVPAGILIFLAFYQLGAWSRLKFPSRMPERAPLAEVTGRQFQWLIRYPGPDARLGTADDIHAVNDLRLVKGQPVVIRLRTMDVIHSFYLPEMRIKQDALPGQTLPVWFDARESGRYELVCAELCGWGHYKMRATVTVYDTQAEFDSWLGERAVEQSRDRPGDATGEAVARASGVAGGPSR